MSMAMPLGSFIFPDYALFPPDFDQPSEPDCFQFLPDGMEQLGVHGFLSPAFFASNLSPQLISSDVANHLTQLQRLVETLDVAIPAPDTCHLPCIVGMH
ncbi:hypothetical protein ACVDG5_036495 [Mesorhizobium sp. ORM6]